MAVSQTSVSKPNISTNQGKKKKITESHSRSDTAQQPEQQISQPPCSSPSKRTKSPGVRVVRGRIYDSENGKTCHQCRQKTRDFTASCKNQKNNKPCTIKFCHKCLLNRYGEKAEEVALLDDWTCPKCRGICNCSFCMKKRGHRPTGILVHTAKATGFSSVSEMLHVKGPENFGVEKILEDASASPNARASPNKKPVAVPAKNRGKENSFNGKSDSNLQSTPLKSNVDGKKIGESKRKKLRLDGGNNNACEGGKDNGPILEKSPKKSRISVEISKKPIKKEGKISGNDIECKDQKKNSQLQISEKIPVEPTKKERKKDETNVPNNGNTENIVAKPKLARKLKKKTLRIYEKDTGVDVQLPQGIDLTTLAGIDLPAEDVGHALQFLEFCAAFGEVLDLKKGQPESIIRELSRGRSGRRGQYSSIVRFHTQLLSLIQKDSGEESPLSPTSSGNSWLQALGKCISESQYASKELLSNSLDRGSDGYDKLDISQKLRVLNFLCDETLGTVDMRNWIDEQNSKFVEREKEAKGKVIAAKDKEKRMKQKLQDEVAKVILLKNSAPLSISEHEDLVSKIKTETAKVHAETLEAINMVPKKKQRLDAVRTEPILLGDNGCVFWKLQGYSGEPNLLRQDIGSWDMVTPQEKWSTYDVEQKEVVEKYFSSLRRKKFGTMTRMLPLGSCEASTKHDTLDDSSSPTLVVEDSENDHES